MNNQKEGLDYFSLYTDIELDDKITLMEAKHGIEGFAIIVKLWAKIYGDKGYYYEWNERTKLIFSRRINIDYKKVEQVVEDAVEFSLFDKNKFKKYGILTSKKIQDHYLHSTRRRKKVEIKKAFLLLNGNNDNIKNNNVYILDDNDDILEHSIVEYSIEENNKESSKNKFATTSIEFKLSSYLYKKILKNNPDQKKPNLQSWAKHIDYMIRLDKRKPKKIKELIDWCQGHSFWHANILSTKKLREQFDQLTLNMKKEPSKKFNAERSDDEFAAAEARYYK